MNSLLIKFNSAVSREQIDQVCGEIGVITRTSKLIPGLVTLSVKEGMEPDSVITSLSGNTLVEKVELNQTASACLTSNDPQSIGSTIKTFLQLEDAWDIETGDGSITVALLDSGIDTTHEDLAGNLWVDPYRMTESCGYDFVNDSWSQTDTDGHGTAMAGIIGAVGNNEVGIAGVCWNVKLMSCKINTISDDIEAIEFAINRGADIINMSHLFTSSSDLLKAAIEAAGDAGILVVCSAGNYADDIDAAGNEVYPACFDSENIITVGACDTDRNHALLFSESSSYGAVSVDMWAPGAGGIKTTVSGGGYTTMAFGGTSSAAAFVSGTAALMKMANKNLHWKDIKTILLNTGATFKLASLVEPPADDALLRASVSDRTLNAYEAVVAASTARSYTAPLNERVPGRQLEVRKIQREDGKYDLELDVSWADATEFSGSTAISIDNGRITSVVEKAFRATEAQVNNKRTEYATLSTGQTGKLEVRERQGDGLYDYEGIIMASILTRRAKPGRALTRTPTPKRGQTSRPPSALRWATPASRGTMTAHWTTSS